MPGEQAYRIELTGRWPRRCRGCGQRMWNPRRWAHRGCAPTALRIEATLRESDARFRERIEQARRQYPEAARLLDQHRSEDS